jgi:SAM-dependent methyltransferase
MKPELNSKWPKSRPQLTKEQEEIYNDWYQFWLSKEGLHGRYKFIDDFGHKYTTKSFFPGCKTLDLGAGNGAHIKFERLASQEYVAVEKNAILVENIKKSYPMVHAIVDDCQKEINFPDNYFDRVLAIHVLEHLDNLPTTLNEVRRILHSSGKFSVVIPCEGGLIYNLGRKLSSERLFVQKYNLSYDWLINYDHVNKASEILDELRARFNIVNVQYFPFVIPIIDFELVIGLTCVPQNR